jgi:radical SAM protein with 4Fe4S-binding SPASM domain
MARRPYRTQEPPFSVTFELTEGCNLRCPFCAVAAIQEHQGKGYKFMELSTMVSAMQQIRDLGWNCRTGFAMRGEPTMHPDYVSMIRTVREHRQRTHMTMLSNGGGIMRKPGALANIKAMFDAGLNTLGLDDYKGIGLVPKILSSIMEDGNMKLTSGRAYDSSLGGFTFYEYPEDLRGNPHQRRPRGTRMLVRIRDIAEQAADKKIGDIAEQAADKKIGNHGKLFNYAGLGFEPNDSMAGKRCHQPFRQLAIRQDGSVAICCNDWRGEYKCGNILKEGIEAIWQGDAMGAAREMLIRGRREMAPCKGCDHRSYRVGLLPDLMGRGKLHRPDEQTARDIAKATRGPSYTAPVLRPWEKGYEGPAVDYKKIEEELRG